MLALISSPAMSQEIARKFTYAADLTGDGRNESVVLAIQGAAMNRPFRWSLSVTDIAGRLLFKVEEDDSWLDEFFGDDGYMAGCSGYEQCKRRYYFEDKPQSVAGCLKKGGTKDLAKVLGSENSLEAARSFLETKKTSPAATKAALQELPTLLQNEQTKSLCFENDPNHHGQNLVWLKTVGGFVPYYVP